MLTEKEFAQFLPFFGFYDAYVKTSGSVCPKCGSDKIEATNPQRFTSTTCRTEVCSYVYSSVMCKDCSFEYEDHGRVMDNSI
jgi:predicted Zn-ribbon and HTH transcriptional regulator